MDFRHEDFQTARRISRAIQEYLEMLNQDGLRSTDVYPYLAKKGLVEKDKEQGIHFRRFLHKLKNNNLLSVIPQCSYRTNNSKQLEWYFYRVTPKEQDKKGKAMTEVGRKLIVPEISEAEIDELIKKAKPHVDKLPKREESTIPYAEKETRKLYARAYEKWTAREIEIMTRAYKKFQRIDKVAELLERQPSAVAKKMEEHQN